MTPGLSVFPGRLPCRGPYSAQLRRLAFWQTLAIVSCETVGWARPALGRRMPLCFHKPKEIRDSAPYFGRIGPTANREPLYLGPYLRHLTSERADTQGRSPTRSWQGGRVPGLPSTQTSMGGGLEGINGVRARTCM